MLNQALNGLPLDYPKASLKLMRAYRETQIDLNDLVDQVRVVKEEVPGGATSDKGSYFLSEIEKYRQRYSK